MPQDADVSVPPTIAQTAIKYRTQILASVSISKKILSKILSLLFLSLLSTALNLKYLMPHDADVSVPINAQASIKYRTEKLAGVNAEKEQLSIQRLLHASAH